MTGAIPLELSQLLRGSSEAVREAAWDELIARHTRLLLAVARSFGGGADEAMDRYAFILEKLRESDFRRLRAYRSDAGARFSTWLTIAARRLCLDHHRTIYGRVRSGGSSDESHLLRKLRRNLVEPTSDEELLEKTEETDALSQESWAVIRERDTMLKQELEKMTARERLLIALRFEDDLTASRIATIIGSSNQFSVYRELNSLLMRLRVALKSRGLDGTSG